MSIILMSLLTAPPISTVIGEPKPEPKQEVVNYVEFDFTPMPAVGEGKYKIQFTVLTADKDLKISAPAEFVRKEGDPASNAEVMALFFNTNRFKAEVVDKTKLRVYGRMWNDKLIPATRGMVESKDLKPEELPKVKNPTKVG